MLALLLLLMGVAMVTVGGTGYAIFGPLTVRHLTDRGQAHRVDGSSLSATGLRWILTGGYRQLDDANLRHLAVPARIMLWMILIGLVLVGLRMLLPG
ncbi:MAG: hypothetical protein M0Q42_00720 [Xanthomonadales bacterium]|nr:hypothetical protein [Xanthomonadales bacterium]